MTPRTAGFLLMIVLATGCRSGSGTGGVFARSDEPLAKGDPLLGARIPPQNLPVPGRDSYGARDRRDPLLGRSTTTTDETRDEQAVKNTKDGSTSSLPPRPTRDEPFRRGVASTPAALAAHLEPDESGLSMGDRRPAGTPASTSRESGSSYDEVVAELRKLGGRVGTPERENGRFVVRCEIPIVADDPGRLRWYEGAGDTAAAAAKQILDQARADRR